MPNYLVQGWPYQNDVLNTTMRSDLVNTRLSTTRSVCPKHFSSIPLASMDRSGWLRSTPYFDGSGSLEDIVHKHVAPYSFSCTIFGNCALHLEVGTDKASMVVAFRLSSLPAPNPPRISKSLPPDRITS